MATEKYIGLSAYCYWERFAAGLELLTRTKTLLISNFTLVHTTQMIAEPITPSIEIPSDLDVISTSYSAGRADVIVESGSTGKRWRIHFHGAAGLRVLDEGDLLEFWPECSSPNGWLFRIQSGGWKDQECLRQGFLLRDTQPDLPEYFVAGENACVSILSFTQPEVSEC